MHCAEIVDAVHGCCSITVTQHAWQLQVMRVRITHCRILDGQKLLQPQKQPLTPTPTSSSPFTGAGGVCWLAYNVCIYLCIDESATLAPAHPNPSRPRHSLFCHLFALHHFINTACVSMMSGQLPMLVLWASRRSTADIVPHHLL